MGDRKREWQMEPCTCTKSAALTVLKKKQNHAMYKFNLLSKQLNEL